jgi:hypothetical protein
LAAKTSNGLIKTMNTKMRETNDDRDESDEDEVVVKGIIGDSIRVIRSRCKVRVDMMVGVRYQLVLRLTARSGPRGFECAGNRDAG